MSKRKVVIFHSQTGTKETVESSAATWGELKKELTSSVEDKSLILSKSKLKITLDSCELPTEDFTIFVYPKESKGGASKKVRKAKKVKKVKKVAKKVAKKAKSSKKPARKVKKAKMPVFIDNDEQLKRASDKLAKELGI